MASKPHPNLKPRGTGLVLGPQEQELSDKQVYIESLGAGYIISDHMMGEGRWRFRGRSRIWRQRVEQVTDPFRSKDLAIASAADEFLTNGGGDDEVE